MVFTSFQVPFLYHCTVEEYESEVARRSEVISCSSDSLIVVDDSLIVVVACTYVFRLVKETDGWWG